MWQFVPYYILKFQKGDWDRTNTLLVRWLNAKLDNTHQWDHSCFWHFKRICQYWKTNNINKDADLKLKITFKKSMMPNWFNSAITWIFSTFLKTGFEIFGSTKLNNCLKVILVLCSISTVHFVHLQHKTPNPTLWHFDLSDNKLANLLPLLLLAKVNISPHLANELPPLVHADVEARLCSFDPHSAPERVCFHNEFCWRNQTQTALLVCYGWESVLSCWLASCLFAFQYLSFT